MQCRAQAGFNIRRRIARDGLQSRLRFDHAVAQRSQGREHFGIHVGITRPAFPARSSPGCDPASCSKIFWAVFLPTPGTRVKTSAAREDGAADGVRRKRREHCQRRSWADAIDLQEQDEQLSLLARLKAIQAEGILAHHQVSVQENLIAGSQLAHAPARADRPADRCRPCRPPGCRDSISTTRPLRIEIMFCLSILRASDDLSRSSLSLTFSRSFSAAAHPGAVQVANGNCQGIGGVIRAGDLDPGQQRSHHLLDLFCPRRHNRRRPA